MLRPRFRNSVLAIVLAGLAAAVPAQESAPESPEEAAQKRIGFYFGMRLTRLSVLGQANGIALISERPPLPGIPFDLAGPEVDVDFNARVNLEFFVGFRLRKAGNVEASFMQWDENQDLLTVAPDGKAIANSLASPLAGISEDIDGDGDVQGFEAGAASEGTEAPDTRLDGAEDLNYNGQADFLRFATSDRIVGQASTDLKVFDVDYTRRLKQFRRFAMDWRAGLRIASLDQTYDIGYRDYGSFGVFIDEEADYTPPLGARCDGNLRTPRLPQDGDGDGETAPNRREFDGDGFLDGNCEGTIEDRIASVETVSEDRIVAQISTQGIGLKLGLDGRFDLSKKWRMTGGFAVSLMSGETEFRYRETFTSERDRYANFIDWDLNRDGKYDMWDLDFDRSCIDNVPPIAPEDCRITVEDMNALGGEDGEVSDVRIRDGASASVVGAPSSQNSGAFTGGNFNDLRVGDAVPESERNRDILREVALLNDLQGKSSGLTPMLDLHVGFEWQFSRFANVGFGIRSTRWFDAGRFRNLADDVVAGRTAEADGDFGLSGAYVTLTIVPR